MEPRSARASTSKRNSLLVASCLFSGLLVLTCVILAGLFFYAVMPLRIEGYAMNPAFPDGAHVLVDRLGLGGVQRGDVIIFRFPLNPSRIYMKRVIGVGGDTVLIQDGTVYLNGQKLDESEYIGPDIRFDFSGPAVTVPEGAYYVLGDNRPESSDSHLWGPVPRENVVGKVIGCYSNCGN